ncbi:MAG: tetratricopeptide repeat protein [Patescibacteria group bacterium]
MKSIEFVDNVLEKETKANFLHIEQLTTKAVAKHKENQKEEAISLYLEVIKLDNNQPAWIYGNVITLMAQTNLLDEGLELGKNAIKIHPESDEIYRALGNIFYIKKDVSKCIKKYQKALYLNEQQPEWVYSKLVGQLLEIDNIDKAISIGEIGITLYPECEWLHFSLGRAHDKKRDFAQAINHYNVAVKLNGSFHEAKRNINYAKTNLQLSKTINWLTSQAQIKQKENKFEEAVNLYLKSIELDSNQPDWVYGNAIILLTENKRFEESYVVQSKAFEKYPDSKLINKLISNNNLKSQNSLYNLLTSTNTETDVDNIFDSRKIAEDIENFVDINISELRRNLMDSAIVSQFEVLLEQILINMENELKIINIEALVRSLAEIKADIHYLKTKLSNPSPEIVDPQARKGINLKQIIGSLPPTVIKCEMNQRIVGSGWHEAEGHGRWSGPGTISSIVLPYPVTGRYKFEMIVKSEAVSGLVDSLKINIDNQPFDFTCIKNKNVFPIIIEGEFVAKEKEHSSFLAIDLILQQTTCSQNFENKDSRLIGLLVEKIMLIPQ